MEDHAGLNTRLYKDMALANDALAYQRSLKSEGRQRALGAYYTPDWMVDTILDDALEPVLDANPGPIHICDPSCGAGAFLLGAAPRLRRRGRVGDRLTGIDIDPFALELTRREFESKGLPLPSLILGNALESHPTDVQVMVGNPPFQNVIGRTDPSPTLKKYPLLGGTADLSFEFLAMAHEVVGISGRIGFVMPRAVLNAPAAASLRDQMHPRVIFMPPRANYFAGACVYVAMLVTGEPGVCLTDQGAVVGAENNWFRLASGVPAPTGGPMLGSEFEVSASLAAGDAYSIRELIEEGGPGFRLITTGLIDPGCHCWGHRVCRFLKKTYDRPTIDPARLNGSLRARASRAERPKVVVAGLSQRLEAYLDPDGSTLGSVSTYTIMHPSDDLRALEQLLATLLSQEATEHFRAELGANAMGGGSITVTKAFLREMPLGATF